MGIWEDMSDFSRKSGDGNKITKLKLKSLHYLVDLWLKAFPGECYLVPQMTVRP